MEYVMCFKRPVRGARPEGFRHGGKRGPLLVRADENRTLKGRGLTMTYRAPVNEMLFMMRHVGQLDRAIADGIYGDLSIDVVRDILEEAARFARQVLAPINQSG